MSVLTDIISYLASGYQERHPFDCRPICWGSATITPKEQPSKRCATAFRELKEARENLDRVDEWLLRQIAEGLDGGLQFNSTSEMAQKKADIMVKKWELQDQINKLNG